MTAIGIFAFESGLSSRLWFRHISNEHYKLRSFDWLIALMGFLFDMTALRLVGYITYGVSIFLLVVVHIMAIPC